MFLAWERKMKHDVTKEEYLKKMTDIGIISLALMSLEAKELIWKVQESLVSRISPNYFTWETNENDWPFMIREGYELQRITEMVWEKESLFLWH